MAQLEDRLTALCDQAIRRVTGIDFIQVVDPHVQTALRIFFVLDPDTLVNPLFGALPATFPPQQVRIASTSGDAPAQVAVTAADWHIVATPTGPRTVLDLALAQAGGFGLYTLTLVDQPAGRFDRFFNGVVFSFKQGCPSVFDCRRLPECPPPEDVDWPVDYLARDFESLRLALLDFAAQRYPLWRDRIAADPVAMLQEIAAALGDELAWLQDRSAAEGSLETLAERRSLRWHTRLVDFTPDEGESATTWLDIAILPGQQGLVNAGTRAWAVIEGEPPIPFELGLGLAAQRENVTFWLSDAWNTIPAHVPDPSQPCLPSGARELYVVGTFPVAAQIPVGADPLTFWLGRPLLIRIDPPDPALPRRAFVVHPTAIEQTVDPLVLNGGVPLSITRIAWSAHEALPNAICLDETTVHANLVQATAGETFVSSFAIADASAVAIGLRDAVDIAVERAGPLDAQTLLRPPIYLYSLAQTAARGLGRLGGVPEVELQEVLPPNLAAPLPARYWQHFATPMSAQPEDAAYTLEHGTWAPVITFDRPDGRVVHVDRASGDGFTLRLGDGEFGRTPADGQLFRVRYRTDVGTRANLAEGSVTTLADPAPAGGPVWPTLVGRAFTVSNPFAIASGREPMPTAEVAQIAPEAYRANPRRAVRDEDYARLAGQLPGVQRAGATRRWTGSWATEFVTVDPLGTVVLSPTERAIVEAEMECVRQAGRPVIVRDPVYLPIDMRVRLCVAPGAYPGEVLERVLAALAGPRRAGHPAPFFDPDHFTFGDPLYRSSLEAAIQGVAGVLAVEDIRVRIRGWFDWQAFPGSVLDVAPERILVLDNDPVRPQDGSLWVTTGSIA